MVSARCKLLPFAKIHLMAVHNKTRTGFTKFTFKKIHINQMQYLLFQRLSPLDSTKKCNQVDDKELYNLMAIRFAKFAKARYSLTIKLDVFAIIRLASAAPQLYQNLPVVQHQPRSNNHNLYCICRIPPCRNLAT